MRPFRTFMYSMIYSTHLLVLINSFSLAKQPLCHDDESSALLQFKQRFSLNKSVSSNPNSYPKLDTWKLEGETSDCCKWDGVECDVHNGHVIGLDLNSSFLYGSIDYTSTLLSLSHLRRLNLGDNHLNYSQIPSEIATLLCLSTLNLSASQLSGTLPASLGNLNHLISLDLSHNQLHGQIPSSFSKLASLRYLDLSFNKINGTLHVDFFQNLRNLSQLQLSYNNIALLTNTTKKNHLPQFKFLGLGSCNLSDFPDFLYFQEKLEVLSLPNNKIKQTPGWMRNRRKGTAQGWYQHPVVLPWLNLRVFDLRDNMLQGSFPLPPTSINGYSVKNNRLTGEIPQMICLCRSLDFLDLSNNNISGTIPPCLSNLSNTLQVINLKGNNFRGTIPQGYTKRCKLTMMDMSQNQVEGQVPISLANCKQLEILNLGENQIQDKFPFWLGALPELQVLILGSNNMKGALSSPTFNLTFPKLRIIDLSDNDFIGSLRLVFSQGWTAMKISNIEWLAYMASNRTVQVQDTIWRASYDYTLTITNKGVKTEYEKILNIFAAIDLSKNKFSGEIPESIGSFQVLKFLNLSNNQLTGVIPSSIENLTQLESLDLSQNKLSGKIPLQLQHLSFLSFLNVSHNHLTGPIPQGNQFNTFQNSSYLGNLALCGDPLSQKCGELEAPPSPPARTDGADDSEFPSGVDWVVIFTGVGSGLVVGLLLGHNITTRYQEWFVRKVGKRPKMIRSANSLESC